LDLRTLHVQRSLITGYGQTFEGPKTPNSRRNVILTETATEALVRHREHQAAEGFPVEGDALAFTNTAGKPINPSHLRCRSFKPILKKAGLPDTTFHAATRHTCCCILLGQGVNPRVVSLQLGHSSVAFTLQRYASYPPGWGDNGAVTTLPAKAGSFSGIAFPNGENRARRTGLKRGGAKFSLESFPSPPGESAAHPETL
jgi:integrase